MNDIRDKASQAAPDNDELVMRARAIFKSACNHADSKYALRLGIARREALAARDRHTAFRAWAPFAGAAAGCALVAAVILMRPNAHTAPVARSSAVAIAEGIGSPDEIPDLNSNQMDMVQNLDFYQWLAAQPRAVAAASGNRH